MKNEELLVQRKNVMPLDIDKLDRYVSTNHMHYMFHNDCKILRTLDPNETEKLSYEKYLEGLPKKAKPKSYLTFILEMRRDKRNKGEDL